MEKFFGVFIIGLLCSVSICPLHAGKLDPNVIFCSEERGMAILPQYTSNAASFHQEEIKGKGFKAAFIDRGFFPSFSKDLAHLIDPVVFSENLIFDPADRLKQHTLFSLNRRLSILKQGNCSSDEEKIKKIDQLENLIKKKLIYDDQFEKRQIMHGSMVMECFNLGAPLGTLFPIDLEGPNEILRNLPETSKISYAIRKAIEHGADVINISMGIPCDDDIIAACKEAQLKDIPIIIAAGNDSLQTWPCFIDQKFVSMSGKPKIELQNEKSGASILFEALNGHGIWFTAALDYEQDGEEKLTSYTMHPTENMKKHCIFVAGTNIPVHQPSPLHKWGGGTSASAPFSAAIYILEKEFVLKNNYSLSSEEILTIMQEEGRPVIHSFKNSQRTDALFPETVVYKALDCLTTKKRIEEIAPLKF